MKPLLVLVDLQEDYLTSARLEPPADSTVERVRRLLQASRELGVPVVHVWTSVNRRTDRRMRHWKESGRWMCEEGTPGHATPRLLEPRDGEAIVHKCGFSGFEGGRLREVIARNGADTLLVCGVHLHACVRQTALDAYCSGLRVVIAEDAVASNDPLHGAMTRQYLEARAIRFACVDDLLRDLADRSEETGRAQGAQAGPMVTAEVDRARAFVESWRETGRDTRAAMVERLAAAIDAEGEALALRMAREVGKPVRFGRGEVHGTVGMLRAIASRWRREEPAGSDGSFTVSRRPHGVVAIITPWNNPLYIPLGKVVPAVLYGNTVVWKPAPEVSGLSGGMMELLSASGWPEELVRRIEGGREAGEALMNAGPVSAATITGSSAAGYAAQAIGARRRIPLQAELGGNNAAIVMPDADLQQAAREIAAGAFEQAGQRCTANGRVVVHAGCREALLELLMTAGASLVWGDPMQDATQVGPMVSAGHRERVASMVERAVAGGARGLWPLGSEPPADSFEAAWYPPVILCCEDRAMEIVQEEVFGPVLVVQTARDWDEAISLCNGVRQGLVASVFTGSRKTIDDFLERAQSGILKVNQSTASAAVDAPFGGWKHSGLGPPEHGEFDRDFYTRPQTIYS